MTLIPNGRASGKVHFAGRCVPGPRGIAAAPLPSIGVLPPMSVMLDLAAFTRLRFRETGRKSWKRSCARVAERQTRWLQVPVSERAWGFKSPLAHAITTKNPGLRTGVLLRPGSGQLRRQQSPQLARDDNSPPHGPFPADRSGEWTTGRGIATRRLVSGRAQAPRIPIRPGPTSCWAPSPHGTAPAKAACCGVP
jgi:hypothetical protein